MTDKDFGKPIKFNEDGFMQLMKENFHLRTENVNQLREILNLKKELQECNNSSTQKQSPQTNS
jgi:hypothetical protein